MSALETSALISLIVLFIHATTWDKQLMSWIKKIIKPDWYISKPIYGCPMCMTPYWGTAIWYWLFDGSFTEWETWLATILAASGWSVVSVILIYIKDYCKSRTRKEDECCL